ncbi:MAG: FecR domain-containing protein [Planctomycetes bacterium]|nr:FecR domain-containing protein [Planctomycetota bacterium]
MLRFRYALSTIILFAAISSFAAFGGEEAKEDSAVGFVSAIKGKAVAKNSKGDARDLDLKSPIYKEDVIITGKRGRVQLVFRDQTVVSLGRESEMKIAEYEFKPEEGKGKMTTRVKEGVFRVMGGKIVDIAPEKFKTETPTATIGIRGSMYTARLRNKQLAVAFEGGKKDPKTGQFLGIWVGNGKGRVPLKKPMMGTIVKGPGEAPMKPMNMSGMMMGEMKEELAASGGDGEEAAADDGAGDGAGDDEQVADGGDATDGGDTGGDVAEGGDGTAADDGTGTDDGFAAGDDLGDPAADAASSASGAAADASQTSAIADTGATKVAGMVVRYRGTPLSNFYLNSPFNQQYLNAGGKVDVIANFKNGRMIGVMDNKLGTDRNTTILFVADINGDTITNINWFGNGEGSSNANPDDEPFAPDGAAGSGSFGNSYSSVSLSASSVVYQGRSSLGDPAAGTWDTSISATADPGKEAPSGTSVWEGYVAGSAQSLDGYTAKFFTNIDPNFRLNLDWDSGTLNGQFYFAEQGGGTIFVRDAINIGGSSSTSAAISEEIIAAKITSGTLGSGAASASINPYGGYILSEDPDKAFSAGISEHLRWGWWELSLNDPASPTHAYMAEGMWVAGERTPATEVASMIGQAGLVGIYNGEAQGIKINTDGNLTDLAKGISRVKIDFGNSQIVGGGESYVKFDTTQLNFNTSAVTSAGFKTTVAGASTSEANGTFYGPGATVVGGNFFANMSGDRFYGVYGARK